MGRVRRLRGIGLALALPLAACLESPPELGAPSCDHATRIAAISLGRDHACARLDNGGVWCWGLNDQGQLGSGSAIDRSQPTQVAGLAEVTRLAVGQDHSCALRNDGSLWCWGSGSNGQLGNGDTEDALEPVESDLAGVADMSLGDDFTCAVTTEGEVDCWGENEHGQAGPSFGENMQAETPVPIEIDGVAVAVVAGKNHACALLDDQRVACWGGADVGQLGDGKLLEGSTAVPVSGLDGVVQVAAGRDHSCAITDDGKLWCWGSNERGQLGFAGDNETDDCTNGEDLPMSCLPVEIDLGARVTAVSAGLHHTCAVIEGGHVLCFGGNEAGQLGYGSYDDSAAPARVSIDEAIDKLAAGETQTCALSATGSVYCWGSNRAAQLAETAALVVSTPVKVPGATGATAIAAGETHTCAVIGGDMQCWGANDAGQLGNGELQARSSPTVVKAISGSPLDMAPGEEHTCVINNQQHPRCWGRASHGELGPEGVGDYVLDAVAVSLPVTSLQIDSGDEHTCALGSDMVAYCWGSDDSGQLGDGEGAGAGVVTPDLTDVVEIACGDEHTCARLAGGEVNCWGANDSGQLGDDSTTPRAMPASSPLVLDSVAIGLGDAFTCSLDDLGHVFCWGDNSFGQLGAGLAVDKYVTPVEVKLPGPATQIAVGTEHACAIASDSGRTVALCWGRNDGGQLGNGTTESANAPVEVLLSDEPLEIAAGRRHTCARLSQAGSTEVYCWGSDIDGTLGSGRELYRSTAYGPISVCP